MWFRKKTLEPRVRDNWEPTSVSMVSKYRKKPVVIEAAVLSPSNAHSVAAWCGGKVITYGVDDHRAKPLLGIDIPTLEGTMRADVRDFVIKGVVGEFYPCKPEIFHKLYDRVTSRGL